MKKQIVLGFGNKARQGKDTAAYGVAGWCNKVDIPVLHVGFADALRQEVSEAIANYGSAENLIGSLNMPHWVKADPNPVVDENYPLGKQSLILQWWGTDYRRAENSNYWVDRWIEKVVGFDGVVVAGDARFTNEAIAIMELGGSTVNVRRLEEDGSQYFDASRSATHPSEIELDKWNWDYRIIAKTGQVALVQAQAVEILKYEMRLKRGWLL